MKIKKEGLPEPEILEKDGGFMVALHKADNTDKGGQDDGQAGGQVEKLIKEFGSIEERIKLEKNESIQYLRSIYKVFMGYLWDNYGISSEMLQDKFR